MGLGTGAASIIFIHAYGRGCILAGDFVGAMVDSRRRIQALWNLFLYELHSLVL